jgi:hypothetical protein
MPTPRAMHRHKPVPPISNDGPHHLSRGGRLPALDGNVPEPHGAVRYRVRLLGGGEAAHVGHQLAGVLHVQAHRAVVGVVVALVLREKQVDGPVVLAPPADGRQRRGRVHDDAEVRDSVRCPFLRIGELRAVGQFVHCEIMGCLVEKFRRYLMIYIRRTELYPRLVDSIAKFAMQAVIQCKTEFA